MSEQIKKAKMVLDKIYQEMEKEGVETGAIMSPKYEEAKEEVKKRILDKMGIEKEDYDRFNFETEKSEEENEIPRENKSGIGKLKDLLNELRGEKGKTGKKGERGDSIKGEEGREGKAGAHGESGKDGRDGKDGKSVSKKEVLEMVKKQAEKKAEAIVKSRILKEKGQTKKDIQKQIKDYMNKNLNIRIPFGGSGRTFQFADAEIPTGTIDGSNKVFTIANTPDPLTSLRVVINTTEKTLTTDYALSEKTITMTSAPRTGAILRVHYRY